jgi:mannitol/fructose-specific phosphotransferase system IIA component (Ntr-type)
MAAALADLLHEQHVTLSLQARTKEEALREIVGTMRANGSFADPDAFLAEVLAREKQHSTFMGRGVAFPHARTNLVKEIVLGIGRSIDGVPFSANEERAHLIFLIAVPQRMVTSYLTCVGALARLASDQKMRDTLDEAATPAEFVQLLRAGSVLLQ